jgi:FkbM family methyltransferase
MNATELAAGVAITDTRYGSLSYFRADDPIGASLREYGEWAQLELEFLFRFLDAGATVVDVGANVGTHSLGFAHVVGARGRVLSFEPQQEVFDLLRENIRANAVDIVRPYRLALGSAPSVRYVPRVDYAAHVNVGGISLLTEPSGESYPVDVMSIDGLALADVRLIKVDVEGMESEVIRGAAETLIRCRPYLFVECNTVAAAAEILASLREARYALFFKRSAAFNPGNFRRNHVNHFGPSHESGVFCVPLELEATARAICREAEGVAPIADLDELAFELLRTPRYGDRTEHDREAELTGREPKRDTAVIAPDRRLAAELKRLEYRVRKQAYDLANAERQAAEELSLLRERAQSAESAAEAARAELVQEVEGREVRIVDQQAALELAYREAGAATLQAAEELSLLRERAQSAESAAEAARAELVQEVEGREVRIVDQQAALELAYREAGAATSTNSELAAQIRALEESSTARGVELLDRVAALAESLKAAHLDVHSRDILIESLLASRSWRFTAPLRKLKRALTSGASGATATAGAEPVDA